MEMVALTMSGNTNIEYRNPKRFDRLTTLSIAEGQIRSTNSPIEILISSFGHWNFGSWEFVSDFVLRISNLLNSIINRFSINDKKFRF